MRASTARRPPGPSLDRDLFGHVKGKWTNLEQIRDGAELGAELDRVQAHCNTMRFSAAIGYVTPDDEHQGRGEAIRQSTP